MKTIKLTQSGRLTATEELPPVESLMLAIMQHTQELSWDNLDQLFDELVGLYGSPEAAAEAVRTGKVSFQYEQ